MSSCTSNFDNNWFISWEYSIAFSIVTELVCYFSTAVVIGFDQVLYSINVTANVVDVIVCVLSGDLRIPVEVHFNTADNTALGV